MKKLFTLTPYEAYKSIANSKQGFDGNKDFIELLIPALKEVSDNVIETILPSWISFNMIVKNFNAIEVAIIREYVIRVENTEREEWEARRRLAEVRQSLQNDLYATYSVHQFQDEIDFLVKQCVEAQLSNDYFTVAVLQEQIQRLSDRQLELRNKINTLRKQHGIIERI